MSPEVPEENPEIRALMMVESALLSLPANVQQRVLDWANAKFGMHDFQPVAEKRP